MMNALIVPCFRRVRMFACRTGWQPGVVAAKVLVWCGWHGIVVFRDLAVVGAVVGGCGCGWRGECVDGSVDGVGDGCCRRRRMSAPSHVTFPGFLFERMSPRPRLMSRRWKRQRKMPWKMLRRPRSWDSITTVGIRWASIG
jgi:hypothetical protein